ncbi:MAG TPA: flavoprotein [Planctomycetota bacterium]|nr:flavoprotein [Planctomycetota bacterium]
MSAKGGKKVAATAAGAKLAAGPLAGKTVTFGIAGGVAAYKAADAIRLFVKAGATVRTILTRNAERFVTPYLLEALTGQPCATRLFNRIEKGGVGSYAHLDFARPLDLFVIAPATANTLYKLAHGAADDLLSTTALSVQCAKLICPSMNVNMWDAPPVQRNVKQLEADGWTVLGPDPGDLACGDTGFGRLVGVDAIFARGAELLAKRS